MAIDEHRNFFTDGRILNFIKYFMERDDVDESLKRKIQSFVVQKILLRINPHEIESVEDHIDWYFNEVWTRFYELIKEIKSAESSGETTSSSATDMPVLGVGVNPGYDWFIKGEKGVRDLPRGDSVSVPGLTGKLVEVIMMPRREDGRSYLEHMAEVCFVEGQWQILVDRQTYEYLSEHAQQSLNLLVLFVMEYESVKRGLLIDRQGELGARAVLNAEVIVKVAEHLNVEQLQQLEEAMDLLGDQDLGLIDKSLVIGPNEHLCTLQDLGALIGEQTEAYRVKFLIYKNIFNKIRLEKQKDIPWAEVSAEGSRQGSLQSFIQSYLVELYS